MYIFVGLGNRGEQFQKTRHNIGRETVLSAQKKYGLPDFSLNKKWAALVSEGKIAPNLAKQAGAPAAKGGLGGKEKIVLLLPETFVNKSGYAAAPAMRFYKIKPGGLILVHDDVDMLLGKTKLSFGKNSGGHKGVESVMRAAKTKNFWRMRIGVQKKRRVPGEDLVLQKFRGNELAIVKKIIKKNLTAIETIAVAGPEQAMNVYNA